MKCTSCGNELSGKALYCARCGTPVSQDSERVCTHCGSTMREGDAYCRICGANTGVKPAPAVNVTFNKNFNCPGCGAPFTPRENYCKNCGNKLPEIIPFSEHIISRGSKKHKNPIAVLKRVKPIYVIAAAALAAVIITVIMLSKPSGELKTGENGQKTKWNASYCSLVNSLYSSAEDVRPTTDKESRL